MKLQSMSSMGGIAMTEIAWPSSPLVKAVDLHGQPDAPFPHQKIEWVEDDEYLYPIRADSITFDIELVSNRVGAAAFFRIGVETVDEDDNTIQEVHPITKEYKVRYSGQSEPVTLGVPLSPSALTHFKVTIGVLDARPMGGSDIWYDESRIFSTLFVPVVEAANKFQEIREKYCFVATAAYGSELAPPVQFLREFRDDVLLKSRYSRVFEKLFDVYYWFGSPIAKVMVRNKPFKYVMKYTVVWPVVAIFGASAFIIKLFVDNGEGPASR